MKKLKTIVICCFVAAIAAGCASVSPQLYTLSPTAGPGGETSALTVTVGPVSLPPVVDRPQLVMNTAPNQLQIDEFNRWAAPLKGEIARVVAENLSILLGSPYVAVFPQTISVSPAYRVTIDVTRFESVPGDTARLTAVWRVRATADGRDQESASSLTEPLRDNAWAAIVAAHNRMIGIMSRDIAASIRKLSADAGKVVPASGK